jgi:hypothetical protein
MNIRTNLSIITWAIFLILLNHMVEVRKVAEPSEDKPIQSVRIEKTAAKLGKIHIPNV